MSIETVRGLPEGHCVGDLSIKLTNSAAPETSRHFHYGGSRRQRTSLTSVQYPSIDYRIFTIDVFLYETCESRMHDVESNTKRKRSLRLYCCYGVSLLLLLASVAASAVSLTITLRDRQTSGHGGDGNGAGSSTSTQTVPPDGMGESKPCTSRDCLPWQLPAVGDVIERNTSFYLPVALLAGRTGLQSAAGGRIYDWQAGGGGASYLAHGMQYSPEEGSIVVPLSGYYNIYCQVQFTDTPQEGVTETGSPHLSFSVYQLPRSPPAYRIMTGGGTVHTVLEGGAWAKTSYVEGVFRLQARDHLYVTVSDLGRVNPYEYATYFGAFLVSR